MDAILHHPLFIPLAVLVVVVALFPLVAGYMLLGLVAGNNTGIIGIAVSDMGGDILEANDCFLRILGFTGEDLDAIEVGALLHDIGKIGVPERILNEPAPLSEDEWEEMKRHPIASDYILSGIELHPFVRQIVRSSHERIDGGGYPDGLRGDEVPLPARIVLVADAFDALASDRPYRRARSIPEVFEEIRVHVGTQFCPTVVSALEQIWHDQPERFSGTNAALRAVG